MLVATRVKMSDSEKKSEQKHVRHVLKKTCNQKSFWKFHVVVVQNNGKEMYKVAFLLIRSSVVFSPFSLPSPLLSWNIAANKLNTDVARFTTHVQTC